MNTQLAIIGLSGRYSGARNTDELWQKLLGEEDFSFYREGYRKKQEVNVYSRVEDIDMFDAEFFHMTPYEAQITDPQQRLLLELSFETLTNAGYARIDRKQCIGVFASVSMSSYLLNNILKNPKYFTGEFDHNLLISNDKDYAATKIAYKLNLSGPAYTIQSACSSSLVALHNACQSLLNYECDAALIGAVSLSIPQETGYNYKEGGIMSPTGQCRPFDEDADGIIKGNGGSVIMIKRLEDAVPDGDAIHAVISGTAINNDGASKIGFTAPSVDGQSHVIRECLEFSGLDGKDIDYIEAHGTGTHLGDPIEMKALSDVYRGITKGIPVGSIKARLGHLDVAAGLTSVIKAVYMLNKDIVPGNTHFKRLNQAISIPDDNFYFPVSPESKPLHHIGVSSFGLGGTNAHIILSKYHKAAGKPNHKARKTHALYMMPLSYLRESDRDDYLDGLADYLEQSGAPVQDVIYALSVGAPVLKNRGYVIGPNKEDLVAKLRSRTINEPEAMSSLPLPFLSLEACRELADAFPGYYAVCQPHLDSAHEFDEYTARHSAWREWISMVCPCCPCEKTPLSQSESALHVGSGGEDNTLEVFFNFLGTCWMRNPIDFGVLYQSLGWQRAHMPPYPLNKKKYWIEPTETKGTGTNLFDPGPELGHDHDHDTKDQLSAQPSANMLSDILFIWSDVLGIESILPDDNYYDIGGDSLLLISILDDVNKKWNMNIKLKDIADLETPRMMARYLREIQPPLREYPFLSIIRQAAQIPAGEPPINLFLIHPAGGTTFCYKQLNRFISPQVGVNIYGLDLPENYLDYPTMSDLAALYMKALLYVQNTGPFYLGGYSFGGNMACEVASQLQKTGHITEDVILFDSHPPEAYNEYKGQEIDYQKIFPLVIANYLQLDGDTIQELYSSQNADKALKMIRERSGGELPMTRDGVDSFYQKWVYSHKLLKSHFPSQNIRAGCMLYKGDVPENEFILRVLQMTPLPKETWRYYFARGLNIAEVPGNHYTIFGDSHNTKCLAALLEDYLVKARSRHQDDSKPASR